MWMIECKAFSAETNSRQQQYLPLTGLGLLYVWPPYDPPLTDSNFRSRLATLMPIGYYESPSVPLSISYRFDLFLFTGRSPKMRSKGLDLDLEPMVELWSMVWNQYATIRPEDLGTCYYSPKWFRRSLLDLSLAPTHSYHRYATVAGGAHMVGVGLWWYTFPLNRL